MSFAEVLNELPTLTVEERQLLVSRVLELDDMPLSASDEILIQERLTVHHQNPSSSVPVSEIKNRLLARFQK